MGSVWSWSLFLKIENQFPVNNLIKDLDIAMKFCVEVAYIETKLGIAFYASRVKVNDNLLVALETEPLMKP